MNRTKHILPITILTIAAAAFADDAPPYVTQFTRAYCVQCHGAKEQKGDLRLDQLKSLDPDAFEEEAESAPVREELARITNNALENGIFGAPTFTIGDEMFWGFDRLDAAIGWAAAR